MYRNYFIIISYNDHFRTVPANALIDSFFNNELFTVQIKDYIIPFMVKFISTTFL